MPRIHYAKSSEFPFHISARSNNRDWFDVPMNYCYGIFIKVFEKCIEKFEVKIHAFVLMDNHFHLIASTPRNNVSEFMHFLMSESSRGIRRKSSRINHIYGGRHRRTLITRAEYFAHCLKYVYRNPVKAGICKNVEDHKFSTVSSEASKMKMLISPIDGGMSEFVPDSHTTLIDWLNEPTDIELDKMCTQSLKRSVCEFKQVRNHRKPFRLDQGLLPTPHPKKVQCT
ncbi:MAG: transposase [Bdellovibrionales bacterium]|nr:transposase [Bdellovibrionales bacterium]